MEWLQTISTISQAGSPFLLVLAVWAFATGKVVPRWIFDLETKRADSWQTLYEREKGTSEKLLEVQHRRDLERAT